MHIGVIKLNMSDKLSGVINMILQVSDFRSTLTPL